MIRPKLKLTLTLAVASCCLTPVAYAAIAPGSSDNGELFLNVYDASVQASYSLDLGIRMNDFFIQAQQEVGFQRFWVLDTSVWNSFAGLVTPTSLQWSVLALDSSGSTAAGLQRLYTTARQGDEAKISTATNAQLSSGLSQGATFFTAVNSVALAQAGRSTHSVADSAVLPTNYDGINGNSYSLSSDSLSNGYYGKSGALTPTLNSNLPFNAGNAVGKSSWFYYLTRSGAPSGNKVTVDEFDNLGFDGYWGFVKVEDQDNTSPFYDPTSPYAGKYLLSFTMPVFDVRTTATFQAFAASINRTEFSGGLQVTGLDGAAAAAITERSAGWVTQLGAASAVTAVPEPGQWALLLAGGAVLAWRYRARRQPA